MKRRQFVKGVASAGFLGAANGETATGAAADTQEGTSALATNSPKSNPPSHLTTTPLVLMAPSEDGVTAIWGVSELCKGQLEWEGLEGGRGIASADDFGMVPQGTKIIRVQLSGLKPGSEYRLRGITTSAVNSTIEASPWKVFRTLSSAASATRFVVWNDTHINDATIKKLHEVTSRGDFLVWNGDTCNDWTKDELLVPTILNPGQCDISDQRPLLLVWGNHDVRGAWAFQLPQMVATPSGRPFYAFRSGPVAVICLHTGEDKPDNHPSFGGRVAFDALRSEQTEWLKETIEKPEFRDAPYRIVFCHIPLRWTTENVPDYDKGGYDYYSFRSRTAWHDSLVRWKTQIVISGHTHEYAWIPANERFPYAQLTGGGPRLSDATWMEAVADSVSLTISTHMLDGSESQVTRFSPLA